MMQHPGIPTGHLYEVPRSVAVHFWAVADVCHHYTPSGNELNTPGLPKLCQLLGLDFTPQLEGSGHAHQLRLLDDVLQRLALLNTHVLLVLQYFGKWNEGCMCLTDRHHLQGLQFYLDRYGFQDPGR